MKNTILILCALISLSALAKSEPAKLRYSLEFIFEKVLEKKNLQKRPEIPFPKFFWASSTPLVYFQDAIESQWGGYRPDIITNAYAMKSNEIFILDEAHYYESKGRCMDDSVAHELVHYLQDRYQHWDFNDDGLEWQAVEIQTAFREEYCK